jgi:hypothetical protein
VGLALLLHRQAHQLLAQESVAVWLRLALALPHSVLVQHSQTQAQQLAQRCQRQIIR